MEVEIKPEEEVKAEVPLEQQETLPMDVSEPKPELNGSNSSKPEVNGTKNEISPRKRQRQKRKKGRKLKKTEGYPKYFQNAYVRYSVETRPKVIAEKPELKDHPVEVTKLVASMWYGLSKEEKQNYLDQAHIDKERYNREVQEFNRLNPDAGKLLEDEEEGPPKKKAKRPRKNAKSVPTSPEILQQLNPNSSLPSTSKQVPTMRKEDELPKTFFIGMDCELQIFTDAFLEHNKTIEAELKTLRKNSIEMEQQNSVLSIHVENMENGVRKVESEIAQTKKKNMQLESYLTKLRCLLAANFNSLSIPGNKGGATVENIDKYMQDLTQETKKPHSTALTKAREILKNIDLKVMP